MKKLLYTLIVLALSTLTATHTSAQTVYKSSGGNSKKKKDGGFHFDKEKVIVGGNFGFYGQRISATETYSFFQLTPLGGYQVSRFDNLGLSLGYQYSRYKFSPYYNPVSGQEYTYRLVLPTYYVGVWNQLFVIPQLFINTEFLYTFFKYPVPNNSTGEYDRISDSAPSLLLGAGYASRSGPDSKFFYAFWLNYDVIQNPKSPYYSNNDLIAGLFYKAGFFFRL